MRLLFKQRMFSWFDSYDIYDERGETAYFVKGQLSWGHKLNIYDVRGNHVATVKEVVLAWMPRFEIYIGDCYVGSIRRRFRLFRPVYDVDFLGWHVEGDFWEWDYTIVNGAGERVAEIGKELFHWTDTYIIDVADANNALYALAFTLAVDAEKCSRN